MTASRIVVLDNEAVQALIDVRHAKHRRALALVEAVAARNLVRAGSVRLVVPTSVRVEAAWDRTNPRTAIINRLRVLDHALDTAASNRGASIRAALHVSVADAHIGCVLAECTSPAIVLTSDVADVEKLGDYLDVDVTVVRL